MGWTTLMLGALTLLGPQPMGSDAHRLMQLDPQAVVIEGRVGLQLNFPLREASVESPLDVVVTGVVEGQAPFELSRERFFQTGTAWALVRHSELAAWDQVVVTWARPGGGGIRTDQAPAVGGPAAGFLARFARNPRTPESTLGSLTESNLAGPGALGVALDPKVQGGLITYECPKTAKKDCTVHLWTINLKTGELMDNKIPLPPDNTFQISAALPAAHSCDGCK